MLLRAKLYPLSVVAMGNSTAATVGLDVARAVRAVEICESAEAVVENNSIPSAPIATVLWDSCRLLCPFVIDKLPLPALAVANGLTPTKAIASVILCAEKPAALVPVGATRSPALFFHASSDWSLKTSRQLSPTDIGSVIAACPPDNTNTGTLEITTGSVTVLLEDIFLNAITTLARCVVGS